MGRYRVGGVGASHYDEIMMIIFCIGGWNYGTTGCLGQGGPYLVTS